MANALLSVKNFTFFGLLLSGCRGSVKRKMTESREWRLFRALFISRAVTGVVLTAEKDVDDWF